MKQLEAELNKVDEKMSGKEKCFPTLMVVGGAIPVVVFLALWFMSPSMVMVDEGGRKVRSKQKVFMWTVGITAVLWALLYGYKRYSGTDSQVCSKA